MCVGDAVPRGLAVNVPVLWPSTSEYAVIMPLARGDRGMLVFSERGMTEFKATGQLASPDVARFFDASDAVFLPSDFGHPVSTPASSTGACIQTHDGRRSVRVERDRVELYCGESYLRIDEEEIVMSAPRYRAL